MDMEKSLNAGKWVTKVADELAEVLQPTINLDWEIKTPDLDWTQSQTAIHTMRACLEYSYQVVGKRIDTYQPVLFEKKDKATPPEYLPMIATAARVLEKVVKDADPSDRAWHAYGISDPVGFAAMGVVEVSVHTYDLAKGFGIDFVIIFKEKTRERDALVSYWRGRCLGVLLFCMIIKEQSSKQKVQGTNTKDQRSKFKFEVYNWLRSFTIHHLPLIIHHLHFYFKLLHGPPLYTCV